MLKAFKWLRKKDFKVKPILRRGGFAVCLCRSSGLCRLGSTDLQQLPHMGYWLPQPLIVLLINHPPGLLIIQALKYATLCASKLQGTIIAAVDTKSDKT